MPDRRVPTLRSIRSKIGLATLLVAAMSACGLSQTADQGWLKRDTIARWPGTSVRALGEDPLELTAVNEIQGQVPPVVFSKQLLETEGIVIGTVDELRKTYPSLKAPARLEPDSFWLRGTHLNMGGQIVVAGSTTRGALFGAFALLRMLRTGATVENLDIVESPAMPIRWVDEWDNADGTIERGYAGRSIFFEAGHVREDLSAVREYARLLASVGINGCNVNNVNGASAFLQPEMLKELARIADAMRPWGVRIAISVDIASPQKIGRLKTYDPLDPEVKEWWKAKANEIYALIPDFAGFTVKADSEGQPGPSSFGRTPADAANTLAAALEPHGGIVLYRAFVYNHHLDWKDTGVPNGGSMPLGWEPKADRARAAYDIFHPLDGRFAPNVVVQTKLGPIDFQVREPVSPLFGGLEYTNQAMELQITQEYTGQQRHLVYLAPLWKQALDFDLHAEGRSTPVKRILAGNAIPTSTAFHRSLGGMVGVAGVGRDAWLGSPLALANLYAFGRLAWDPNLSPEQIAEEWTRQSISNDPQVVRTVRQMLMQSWPAYESYTGPLGMQTLTDITGSHYGPNIESSEANGWGQWHRADHNGIGMDRTMATGTGFTGQYFPQVARIYESLNTCPDELLLFFHHVPYTYKLHSGKTVIQYIYDSHYEGAAQAAQLATDWKTLEGRIDQKLYEDVRNRLNYQAGHAIVWRDAIVQYFLKLSGIPDEKGRAGHYPGRLEAEDARLTGYKVIDVSPWEDASGGKAVSCAAANCAAEWTYTGKAGRFDIAVQYFDLQGGAAKLTLDANDKHLATWTADAILPSRQPHGDNSTRYTAHGVELKPGDTIRVAGTPDGTDPAALDYIEIIPAAPSAAHASQ